ncbi:metal ABC transporter permease [Rosenbergiella collisarenosi]|uniref:metal ABC transporter permease n=1 Tax=Rosenbergiella collisarenosi TaxID=1544695 RepID=UPI001F4E1CAD|nr:metal ABC transporter permease [Rosenbergiella collisarenosi]
MSFLQPFIEFDFMRRALLSCLCLSLSATPLGVILSLRRLSLAGDALSHAVLPGAAIGYLFFGMSTLAMGVGGLVAGLLVALVSGIISRTTLLKEDASFSGLYMGALALGITLISLKGSGMDLLNILFGSLLAVSHSALLTTSLICLASLLMLRVIYRPLIIDTFDSDFLRVGHRPLAIATHGLFLFLVVLNLVAGFQILGTLMSVGLMMVPAVSARFWAVRLVPTMIIASIIALLSSFIGLLLSWYSALPAGPAVVLCSAVFFLVSCLMGRANGWLARHSFRHSGASS